MGRAFLPIIAIAICLAPASGEVIEKVIASVNGEAITLTELEDQLRRMGAPDTGQARKAALDDLINRKLLLQEARRYGIFALESEVEAELRKLSSSFISREAFEEEMRKRGISEEELRERIKEDVIIYKLVKRKFEAALPPVTDLEAAEYYRKNRDRFIDPEKARIDQVIVPKEEGLKKAEGLLGRLRRGEEVGGDGVKVVRSSAYIPVDQLPPEMKRLIGSMREGEWGGPVETPAGYVIVKLIDRKPRRLKSFEEVKEEIKSIILSERVRRELTNWLRKQRREADIRIIEPSLR